jgi:hypothetical protein
MSRLQVRQKLPDRDIQHWLECRRIFKKCNKQHIMPVDSNRQTVVPQRVSVDSAVKGDCNRGTVQCRGSGEANPWSTVFETSVCALSIGRQQNWEKLQIGIRTQNNVCTCAGYSLESDSWNSCDCLVSITGCFTCLNCSDNKCYALLNLSVTIQRDSNRWTQFRTSIFPKLYTVCEWPT